MTTGNTVIVSKKTRNTVIVESGTTSEVIEVHDPGVAGPPNVLSIGTVTAGNAFDVTISGVPPQQVLDFVLAVGGTYVHTQYTIASTWNITHNLGYNPNVTVVDSSGEVVEGTIQYTNQTSIVLLFSAPFSGTAYLS